MIMKNNFIAKILWSAAVAAVAGSMALSCKEPQPESPVEPVDPNAPGEITISVPDTIQIPGEYPVPHPEIPMKIYDRECVVSDAGVSVEAFDITENNFKFTLRPGKDVASYKLDVYPLANLYNYMIDEGGLGADERTVERIILSHLFNAEGNGGYAFTAKDLGADYQEFTIDWGNSQYAQLAPVPDAQYIIAVAGCYDESASESAATELTLVYVCTDSKPLIGNPSVDIDVNAQYRGAIISHTPNADCAGIYYFGTNQDMLDPYVDAFGDRMLRDLMRHWYVPNTPIPVDNPDNLWYQIGPWDNPDPNLMITTVAFGVDANGTPGKVFSRKDFHLKEIPQDADEAMLKYELDPENYSATYAEYKITLGKECRSGYHYALKMDDYTADGNIAPARYYIEGTDEARAELANALALAGYGTANANFSFDEEKNEAIGNSFDGRWVDYNLTPDTEYVIAYCGKNFYGEITELHFSEPFRTKKLITDTPEANKSNIKLEFSDVTRTSIKFDFSYDPSNTACFKFICIKNGDFNLSEAYSWVEVPSVDASQEDLWRFFKTMDQSLFMNLWPRSASGTDSYTLVGLEPGAEVAYAYYAEDMNGVTSEIKVATVTLEQMQVGADPEVEIIPAWDEATKTWTVKFNMVKDCEKFKYTLNNDDNMYLYRLGTSEMRAFEFYDHWDQFVGMNGLETNYESVTEVSEPGKDHVALAVAWGRDENGAEVISKLEYVILTKDGQQKLISDYYPNYVEK